MKTHGNRSSCGSCGCDADRRAFMQKVALMAAGMVVGPAGFSAARALPMAWGDAEAKAGDEITYPIPPSDGVTIDRDNAVIIVRFQGKVFAFNLSCPHQNAAVRWKPTEMRFECTKHDSVYTPDGTYTAGRATRNMDRFTIRKDGGKIVVNVAQMIASDEQKALWDKAFVAV